MVVTKLAWTKKSLMATFAAFGFFIGTATYFISDWFSTNNIIRITSIPIREIFSAPWFIAGIIGSIISLVIIFAFARFSSKT